MTPPGRRPAVPDEDPGWGPSILRGFLVFLLIAGIGILAAVTTFALAVPNVSLVGALRVGALYLGPFHHVALVFEGDLAVDASRLPGANLPAGGSATVELGVALLAVTALAMWLLFRAGRSSAFGQRASVRGLTGARVAFGYAPPVALVALLVRFDEPVELGSFVSGGVRVSLSCGRRSCSRSSSRRSRGRRAGCGRGRRGRANAHRRCVPGPCSAAGWRMFLVAIGLSYAGLFVAGIVQPDEPIALATPSTARYFGTVFQRPGPGAAILAHHLALSPNEAIWTLVPAAGGCDIVRGSERADILCYRRFPSFVASSGEVAFGNAPAGYLAFLLVPAIATIAGGRWAGSASGRSGAGAAAVGSAAGVVFAVVMLAACVLSSITLSYGTTAGSLGRGGHLWVGPDPVTGTLFALAWGVAGGALGGATAGFRGWTTGRTRSG